MSSAFWGEVLLHNPGTWPCSMLWLCRLKMWKKSYNGEFRRNVFCISSAIGIKLFLFHWLEHGHILGNLWIELKFGPRNCNGWSSSIISAMRMNVILKEVFSCPWSPWMCSLTCSCWMGCLESYSTFFCWSLCSVDSSKNIFTVTYLFMS